MTHVTFTGTRKGMTDFQRLALHSMLSYESSSIVFHHGDCIGADEQAHEIARSAGVARIVIHPCTLTAQRAFCQGEEILPAADPLVRNRVMVRAADAVIACPAQDKEVWRGSGTWATIRYARRIHMSLAIIYPDHLEETTSA